MSSSLGIYIDKNLIKYAKLKKTKDSLIIESFNVEVFEDLETALRKVITETNSEKDSICINVSNELYNYFDVFSVLDKRDISKSLNIEFEMLCHEKGYDFDSLDSRYILMENKEDFEKYKAMYISVNKRELEKKLDILSEYKVFSMTPISTTITNLIDYSSNENIAIINIENETKITTIVDGQIDRVDILNYGIENITDRINKIELSWKKTYDTFKNLTIYSKEVQETNEKENEYIDIVMPVLYKIATETQKIFNTTKQKIDKVYITGIGAEINNIDLYFQDFLKKTKCEILKPFFVDTNDFSAPTKELVEVNSAVALALEGIGYLNKDLNFVPSSKIENIENIINAKENLNVDSLKKIMKIPLNIEEKMIARVIASFCMGIIVFSCFSLIIGNTLKKQKEQINKSLAETATEISNIDSDLSKIESHINTYTTLIKSVNSSKNTPITNKKSRTIEKDAIPNLLKRIMYIIPQKVQIISIENTENNHIVIEAVSEKYEQIGYFIAAIKEEKILDNIQSTSGTKSDSLVEITIEGDLP